MTSRSIFIDAKDIDPDGLSSIFQSILLPETVVTIVRGVKLGKALKGSLTYMDRL